MNSPPFRLCSVVLILSTLFLTPSQTSLAESGRPPQDPLPAKGSHHPLQEERSSLPSEPETAASPESTGDPDDFGYTWDNSVAYSWIDAKAPGSNSNLYGGDIYQGLVEIGFPFKFYENTYTQLYFSTKGMVSFADGTYAYVNTSIPKQAKPNNFIAGFWDDLGMYNGNRPDAGIFLYSSGVAPNRFYVIEWLRGDFYSGSGPSGNGNGDFTFDVILHENRDIVVQHQSMNGSVTDATVGIEDAMGIRAAVYL